MEKATAAVLYSRRIDLVTDMVQRHFATCGIKTHKHGTGKDGKRAIVEVGFHSTIAVRPCGLVLPGAECRELCPLPLPVFFGPPL